MFLLVLFFIFDIAFPLVAFSVNSGMYILQYDSLENVSLKNVPKISENVGALIDDKAASIMRIAVYPHQCSTFPLEFGCFF